MAGLVGIYGLVISVLIVDALEEKSALHTNFLMLGAGLSVGISGLAAGFSIGIIGDAGVRSSAQQPKMFVGMIMLLIFAEVLGEFEFKYMGKKRNLIIKRSLWHNCRGHVAVRVEKGRNTMLVNSIVLGKTIPGTEGSRSAGGKYYAGDQRLLAWHNTGANIAESYSANQHLLTKRSIYKHNKLNLSLHAGRALEALNVAI
jgi:F0F1-type ATP synthase membrane subunit c/vacuolar-type H+-ATPase subunit K